MCIILALSSSEARRGYAVCAATLERLVRDLSSEMPAEREGAVALLSGLTVYLEHHPALLGAGVLPALMRAVTNPETIPQVSAYS